MMVFIIFGYLMDINAGKYLPSANGLVGATNAPLDDCFGGIFLKKSSKISSKIFFKFFIMFG